MLPPPPSPAQPCTDPYTNPLSADWMAARTAVAVAEAPPVAATLALSSVGQAARAGAICSDTPDHTPGTQCEPVARGVTDT